MQRFTYASQSYPDYLDLRDRNRTFESMIAFQIIGPIGVDTGAHPSIAWPFMASGNYFDALNVQPYLGRFFHASDEKGEDSAPYVVPAMPTGTVISTATPPSSAAPSRSTSTRSPIIGVAQPAFRGTELFFAPDVWIPIVENPIFVGPESLKNRGDHSPMIVGRLRPGVTPAVATADLNAIGAWLAKAYPAANDGVKFTLARPGLVGDMLAGPARVFMAGLMLLAGLILLAACANRGSLFAARVADRGKEVALRLALGSRRGLVLRQLFTEALLVSLAGGALGLAGGVLILRLLSAWQPIPGIPVNVPVNPDLRTCVVALLLALVSGFLFGMVPVRQLLRADPWRIIRTGMNSDGLKRFSVRDVLLVLQIAICAVLVTSSLVAVRGLVRSMHSNFGFVPQNAIIAGADLHMGGYEGDRIPQMQRRMIDAVSAIPGVSAAGYITRPPLSVGAGDLLRLHRHHHRFPSHQLRRRCHDLQHLPPATCRPQARACSRAATWPSVTTSRSHCGPCEPHLRHQGLPGSIQKAVGSHFKYWSGKRAEVVGVVEDGKYRTLTEDQMPAMFFSFLQQSQNDTTLVVRSERDPHER